MVLLKGEQRGGWLQLREFQFQYGAIKRKGKRILGYG